MKTRTVCRCAADHAAPNQSKSGGGYFKSIRRRTLFRYFISFRTVFNFFSLNGG